MTDRASTPGSTPRPSDPSASPRRWGDLLPRVASGLVMVAVALGVTALGHLVFLLFWLAASVAILWEWQRLVGADGATRRASLGAVALVLAVMAATLGWPVAAALLWLTGLLALIWLAPIAARWLGPAGFLYATALVAATVILRGSEPHGMAVILWLFAVVWGTDVMAYFGGRLIGGPKLWPRVSPSKTWSGFLTGIGSGALAGAAVAATVPGASVPVVLLVGLLTGAVAQGGDLFESTLKRRFGAKDSSHLIPGHGGVMDRLDGFLTAASAAALLGVVRAGLDAASQGLFMWPR